MDSPLPIPVPSACALIVDKTGHASLHQLSNWQADEVREQLEHACTLEGDGSDLRLLNRMFQMIRTVVAYRVTSSYRVRVERI